MKRYSWKICALLICLCLVGFPSFLYAKEGLKTPLSKVSLQLRWHHQFQFAGFYAAKAQKFYQQEGLVVEIKSGASNLDTVSEVLSGRAQFGVTNSQILLSRLKDKKPVVVLAPIFQHSPLVFLTRKETGINHPQDFIGKRIKFTQQIMDIELHTILLNEGVKFNQFERIDGPWKKQDLFDETIDVVSAYITNEPYYYIEKGIEFNIIRPSAYGVDFYGDTIFTSQAYAQRYPGRAQAFKRASIKGWEYAMAHKKEIINLILNEYNTGKSRSHLEYEAARVNKLILPKLVSIGHNNPGRWAHIANIFVQNGFLNKDYSLEGFIFEPSSIKDHFWVWFAIVCLSGGVLLFSIIIIALYIFNNRLNKEIKEKEKSKEALAQSEARLNAIFENIYSGVAIFSAVDHGRDFIVKSFNKAALRMENIGLEKVLGKLVSQVFPLMRVSGLLEVIERVYHSGQPEHLPTRRYQNKQIIEWRENYVYKLPSGEIVVVCNEETVRKKAETNRTHLDTINHIIINTRHSKDMLQKLLDAMLDIFECDRVWLLYPCDPTADYFKINVESARPGYAGLGASDRKIPLTFELASSMKSLLDADQPVVYDTQEMYEMHGRMAQKYQIKSEIRMALFPKIDQAWMLGMHRCESSALWTTEDRVLLNAIGRRISDGLNAILLIEELKTANQTLGESEERFEKIFHSSPVGLIIATGEDLKILDVNLSCLQITGYSEKDLLGGKLLQEDFIFALQSLSVLESLKQNDALSQVDISFHNKVGEIRDGHLSSQVVTITGKKCIAVTIEDITEYKKAQKEKQAAHQHAAEQEKYALIGQVAGKMAHDFNNILGAIMGNTELSLLECENPEDRKTFQLILEQTKRGRNLTRNLVVFAKDQEPRQDYFNLNEKIDLVLNLLKKDLEGIEVARYFSQSLPELLADPGMIENALVNIIHNAIHAMSKTHISKLILRTSCDEKNILMEVIDNGCGIPLEHQNSIYTPTFTLKNDKDILDAYDISVKGTGYGLFNVKKIVEKHKGTIRFESQIDKGTRFLINFPVIKRDLTQEEKVEIEKSTLVKNKRILIVEDEPSIFDVQSMILESEPFFHEVDIAQNVSMAMTFLTKESYDLISLDYFLPGGSNGMDLYNTIRESNMDVPILFISGNIEFLESIISLTQKDKFLDYLSKPCQNKAYVDSINRLLERSSIQGKGL